MTHFSMIPFSPNLAPQIPAAMVIMTSNIFPFLPQWVGHKIYEAVFHAASMSWSWKFANVQSGKKKQKTKKKQ